MHKIIKVGTRPSRLAVLQAKEIQNLFSDLAMQLVVIETLGDRDKTSSLWREGNTDFFTREIEEALLDGKIQAAVHSAKDIESPGPGGLGIVAITASISPLECLVSRSGLSLLGLPEGSCIGTSSPKRRDAVLRLRKDLEVADIRGTIEERLAQLDSGKYDALIVAHAALIRLGLEHRISEIILERTMEPHPLQGRLAVQIRQDREDLYRIFRGIDAKRSR